MFAPDSTNFSDNLKPIFPSPKIKIFFPPMPLLSFKNKLFINVSAELIAKSLAL